MKKEAKREHSDNKQIALIMNKNSADSESLKKRRWRHCDWESKERNGEKNEKKKLKEKCYLVSLAASLS